MQVADGLLPQANVVTQKPRPPARKSVNASSLARKRYALRLPLALASRLEALHEMHADTTRAQLITDLLGLGLAQVERQALSPPVTGSPSFHPDIRQPIYLLTGPFSEFHALTHKHHLEMERELDGDDPLDQHTSDDFELGDAR